MPLDDIIDRYSFFFVAIVVTVICMFDYNWIAAGLAVLCGVQDLRIQNLNSLIDYINDENDEK